MAEASYTSKIKYSIDDLMSSLVACKTQAEQVDGVLANIGKRGNLNNFIKQFVAMDDAVKALRKDLDSVKAGLGDKLNSGYMKSFDKMVEQMSQISELSKNVFTGLSGVNLKDKGAAKELLSYAEQLNTILRNVGIDKQIDLDLFNTKSVEEQFNALIQYASELNGKLNIAFGEIDLSKVGDNIKSAGEEVSSDIKDTGNKISEEVQHQIDELEKQKARYQEALDIFNGKDKRVKTTKKNDTTILAGLVEDFKKAEQELAELERTGKSGQEEALAKKMMAASQLKSTMDYVFEHGSDDATAYAAKSEEYDRAEEFLEEFRTRQNATLEKMKSEYKQKIADINSEIAKLGKDVPETKNEPQNAVISYEKLTKAVDKYYKLQSKLDTAVDSNEFNKIADEADKIAESFINMDSACSKVFDSIQDGLGKSEALSQLANIFNVQPSGVEAGAKATQEAAVAASKKADEEERAYQAITKSIEAQRVMYHLGTGSAINGTGTRRDAFVDMLDNLTTSASGTRYEKYGFGLLGSGILGVQNPSTIPKDQASNTGKFIYSLDLSKYNMYLLDTEERAANLMDFMSKLQKIAIRGAVPNYTGFNEFLGDTDLNSLYEQFTTLFDKTKLTKEQLGSFIDEMVAQLTQAGLFFDSESGQLDFRNISDELANSDNISTRFLKKLGYQGVNVGNTSLDGFGQGSVLFDFNESDIVGYFNTIEQAAQDFQNNLKSGWVGSNEQLQQYLANIEEIITRINAAKQNKLQLVPDFDTSGYDNTLTLLNNVKTNISNILSGTAGTGDSNFATVTDNQTAQLEKEKELMQEIAALKEKLNAIPTNPVDASELEAAQKQVQELEAEILRMEGALDSWKSSYYDIQNALDASVPMSEVDNMTSNDIVDEYRAKIENLSSVIDELKTKLAEAKAQLGSATEAKQKGTDAAEQELAVEKQQNEEAKQQLATQQQITKEKEKQTQSDAAKVSKVETGKVVNGQGTGEPAATAPEVTSASGVQESFAAATEQKNQFVEANAKVKESAESSAVAIEKEIEKAREVGEAFETATNAKNNFANANQNVKDSADKTAGSLENEAAAANKGTRKGKTSRSSSSEGSNEGYKELDNYKTLIDANQKLSSAFRKIDTEVFVDKDSDLGQLKSRYEALSKEIQNLTKSEEAFGKVSEDDMQRLSAATKQLMSDFEKYAKVKKDSAKQSNTSYGADVVGQVEAKHTGLINSVNSKGYANASGLTTQLQQYEQAYQRIITLQKELANIDITSDLGKQKAAEFDSAVESFNKYGKAIENIIKKSEEMKNKVGNITRAVSDGFDIGDEASRRSELEAFANSFDGLDKKSIQFADNYSKVTFTIKNGNGEVEKLTASFNQAGNAINATSKNMGKASSMFGSFFSNVKKKSGEILTYFTGANMIYKTVAQIKQGISYVKEIDSALTELKKVTDETDETYEQFLKTMSATGAEIGATVSNLTNMAASWARLGYSIKEAGDLAKSTAVLLNVSEFTDADTASEALISTMQAYGYAAEDSMHVVDVLNEVGNNFAVSSDGLATALQNSASSLMAAGNNLEQSVAMVAAANKVLQDPSSVGAALRTISLRIRGTSTKVLEEMGEETDGVIESVSKLQAKVKGLSGVDILTDTGAYKDTYTIIKEIAEVWDQMSDIDQAALLELLAGKNRSNAMAALIGNLDDLEGAYETAMDAQGSAEAENEKYLNSIQGKVDQFTNALQTMWTNFIDSSIIKFIVDVGTGLVQLADNIGLVGTAITAVVAKLALTKGFSELKNTINDVKTAFSTAMNVAKGAISTISSFSGEGLASFLGGKIETSSISAITQAINAEIAAQGALNKELAKTILHKHGVRDEDIEGALAAMGYTSANGALTFSFKALGASIWQAAKAFWASPFGKFALIAAGVALVVHILDQLITTHGEYVDKLKETSDEISDVRSDIKSLNNELKTTQERIDELNSKDKLSFTEKEELKNLKAQNAELERSIRLEEQKEKRLQKKAARQLNDAVKTDWSVFGNTQVYKNAKGEYVSASEAIDVNSNNYAVNGDPLKEGYSRETVSIIQSKIIEYQRAQKELNEAKDELENIGDDATDKQVKAAENKVADLEKKATDAHDALSETMDQLDEDYLSQEGVEWQYGNPDELEEWQKQMNANLKLIYDAQDQLAIASDTTGKAIESAFSRVSSQTEFEDELKTIQETAGITGEKLKEMYDSSTDMSDTGLRAYIQSLLDCGVIANTSAEELQKVVDLSIELGGNASDAATANKKLARSQKMLQYYKQYKELNKYTQKLKDAKKGTDSLTSTEKKQISTIRTKMQAIAKEIDAYDILGEQIEEARQSFEDFESAKNSDENNNHISTAGEMFQAVIDGYQSAEMGSETFKSAFKSLIPESVYKDLDTLEDRYTAAAEYISGTLSKYFKIEYDDDGAIESVETTTKNIETFIEDAKNKKDANGNPLMSFSEGTWTVNQTDFKEFARAMGITEEMLVAIGEQIDKTDADWIMGDVSSFFDSFDMDTEANIYRATKALANLDQQFIDGEIDSDAYGKAYSEALLKYNTNVEEARSNVAKFVETQELYKEQQEKINNLLDEYKKKKNIGEDTSEIKKQIEEATKQLGEYGQQLESYGVTELSITVAKEQVEKDIQEIEDKYTDFADKVEQDEKTGKWQIKSGITFEEGSEDQQVLEKYVSLLNENYNLDVLLGDDTVDSYTVLQDISTTLQEISDLLSGVTAKKWIINVGANIAQGVKDFWNWLGGGGNASQEAGGGGSSGATSLNGNAHFDGAANASGTLGAEATSTSLVGELGPELRVRGNRWELLGENGAEFADVKKGDIIFNHKQTEQLLKNGYVSGRGKAYAEGTNNTFASRVSRGNSIDYEKCIKLLSQYEKDVAQAAKESNDYIAKLDDRYKKYGNIDNVDRNIVLWNDENLNKYSAYIDSMANLYDTSAKEFADDLAGSWSTVLGASDRFEFNGQSMEVAYSQMLNNGADTKLLTYEELENYMYDLMQRSMVNGSVDPNRMVELDSNGIVEDIQGEMVLVKDLLAGVEGQLVDGIKLSQEDIQTMAGNLTNSSSIYNGYSMHDIQENTLWKDAVAHYGMGGSAFVELEAEAESYGLTLDELIAKTESYRETTQTPLQQDVNIGATIDAEGIAQKIYSVFSNIFSTISSWFGNLFSGGDSGDKESGGSYARGSNGLTSNETGSLVGELGTEMLVRNGKWQTIGENGAEMMNLKRGDIIFNHQQTEALLKNGFVNSRGKAFASGNAHVGTSGTIFTKYATVSGYGGTVPDWFGHSNILGTLGDVSDASGAVEDAADDAKQTIDFIEYRLEEIENSITNMTNRVENFLDDTSQTTEKNNLYEGLIDAEKQKASTYFAAAEAYNKKAVQLLSEIPSQYREMAKNGAIAIKDFIGESEGEIADAIEEYRTWSTKAEDAENSYLESIAEISAKRLEQLQDIADDFENIVGITEQHSNLIQAEMDLLDEAGERLSENFYKELMKDSQKQITDLNNKRAALQNILDQAVKSGDVRVGTDDWYEMVNAIYDVDDSILECKKDIEGFQNSINDLYWDNLDKLIDKIDNVDSELSHLYNLVSDEEQVVDEFGNWTKDGVTALGLLAQQLEVANFKVDQYGEAIARLKKDYAAGLYSTDEYNEKLAELKENQWDAIEAQESAKKSIIDLNKTRIQAVKDGMQKEISAYSELIDKKKEELNLQKEAHDFSKQVTEQQKNIADIEKRLAAMAGDSSASAIAQKKKLQAELAQARQELDELYYDHSIEKQQEALDKSLEDYQNNKQDEMDALDESLKNENQIIQDSYATIAANTELLAQNLTDIADRYGVSLSDSVTKPWLEGANAIGTYQEQLDTSTSAFTDQLKLIKQELADLQVEADKTANSIINATNGKKGKTEGAKYTPPKSNSQNNSSQTSKPKASPSKGASVTVKKSATNFSRNGGNGTRMQSWVPGATFTVYQVSGSEVLIGRNGGYTGWVKLSDIEGYASGAKSINKDQFAFLDELGEELQLVPDGAGRLSYLRKGTGIIPADLTERLMEWGQLDPSSVLEQSRPTVSAPHVINNNIELNMEFGNLVHVDTVSNDTLPELQKMVRSEFDNCMKSLNNSLKRFCR